LVDVYALWKHGYIAHIWDDRERALFDRYLWTRQDRWALSMSDVQVRMMHGSGIHAFTVSSSHGTARILWVTGIGYLYDSVEQITGTSLNILNLLAQQTPCTTLPLVIAKINTSFERPPFGDFKQILQIGTRGEWLFSDNLKR
jgi:hypothetical protein